MPASQIVVGLRLSCVSLSTNPPWQIGIVNSHPWSRLPALIIKDWSRWLDAEFDWPAGVMVDIIHYIVHHDEQVFT